MCCEVEHKIHYYKGISGGPTSDWIELEKLFSVKYTNPRER